MKKCSKCGEEKTLGDFSVSKRAKDGREGRCKICLNNLRKVYYKGNKEKFRTYEATYRVGNKKAISARAKRCYCRYKSRAKTALYRARKLKATPYWANLKAIRLFYKNCPEGFDVDHIIPLQGKNIRGLHILSNLQYLTIYANRSKGNSYEIN